MTVFLGLDLAWTPHRETGICAFDHEGRLLALETRVASPEQFADLACSFGEDVIVAVDAPLIVTPMRSAERAVARAFGRFHASPHQANLELLRTTHRMAGPELHAVLIARGFGCEPALLVPGTPGRHAMEVYPHAAHVRAFNLRERLPYKRKKGRTVAFIRAQLRIYQDHLRSLLERDVPALLAAPAIANVLAPPAVERRGAALKQLEDLLDAVTCAWVARHAWCHGAAAIEVFGDEHGHVVVPRAGEVTFAPVPTSPLVRVFAPATLSPPTQAEASPS